MVAPSGLFLAGYPYTPDNNELINCNNPLLSAQQRGTICSPAMITYANANPSSPCQVSATGVVSTNCADVSIGRRNIEGGGRTSIYQHQNFRFVIGTKGDVIDGWNYDLYASYYYGEHVPGE